jgi:hypothetical protein
VQQDLPDQLVQPVPWAPPAQPDRKVLLVNKDRKEILAQAALRDQRVQPAVWAPSARADQPGRKAPWERLARREGLPADVSFRAPTLSWCRLESAA